MLAAGPGAGRDVTWITPETVATALEEMAAPETFLVEEPAAGSRLYGRNRDHRDRHGGLATLGALLQYDRYDTRVIDHGNYFTKYRELVQHDKDLRERWKNIAIGRDCFGRRLNAVLAETKRTDLQFSAGVERHQQQRHVHDVVVVRESLHSSPTSSCARTTRFALGTYGLCVCCGGHEGASCACNNIQYVRGNCNHHELV